MVKCHNPYLFVVIVLILLNSFAYGEETKIHVIDVGTGDAVLIENNDSYILIDAGPERNTTASYLVGHNITDISLLLVSGTSSEKTGGILEVMNRTKVHEYRDYGKSDLPYYNRITSHIRNESIPHTPLLSGEVIPFGNVGKIEVIPEIIQDATQTRDAIIKITVGKISTLLLSQNPNPQINITDPIQIIRVADHGSRDGYNARFIQSIQPEVAVISVGRETEGPNKATTMGLEAFGAEIYRTDIKGTILITTDGEKYIMGSSRSSPGGSISLVSVIETRPPG